MSGSLATLIAHLEDDRFFFSAPSQAEALARLHFSCEHKLDCALVLGAPGSGKTALLRQFQLEMRTLPTHAFFVNLNGMSAEELTLRFALDLGIPAQEISGSLWLQVMRELTEMSYNQLPLVLLCDDLHLAQSVVPLWLTRVWGLVPAHKLPVTLVCSVDDTYPLERLPVALRDRIDLRVELEAWSLHDLQQFVATLSQAAQLTEPIFSPSVLERLHQLSGGNPRMIRKLVRMSALTLMGQAQPSLSESTLLSVSEELCGVASSGWESLVAVS